MTGLSVVSGLEIGGYYLISRSAITGVAPDSSPPLLAKIIAEKVGYPGLYIRCEVVWPGKRPGLGVVMRDRFCSVEHVVRKAEVTEVVQFCTDNEVSFGRVVYAVVGSCYLGIVNAGPALIRVVAPPPAKSGFVPEPQIVADAVHCQVIWIGGTARGENARQDHLTCSLLDLTREVSEEEVGTIKALIGVTTDF